MTASYTKSFKAGDHYTMNPQCRSRPLPLPFAHGPFGPMENAECKSSYVQAQHRFTFVFFRTALRFRGHYTTNQVWGKVLVLGSDFFLAHLAEGPYNRGKSFQGGRFIRECDWTVAAYEEEVRDA